MDILERISEETIEFMINEIKQTNGKEIFFRGILDEMNIIERAEVLARGNTNSAPAIIRRMKKGEVIIHNHPSGYLYPSDADVSISSMFGNIGGGSYIINNDVNEIYVVVEPETVENFTEIEIDGYFEKDGKLANLFKGFEYRHEQFEMADSVKEALNIRKKAIIEAGTGTGKTFAYLVPSMLWALENEKKVVVSTNTINLQEQLIEKDIPMIKKIIEKDFNEVLVKGRSNYLCIRKTKNIISEKENANELNDYQTQQLQRVINWAGKTSTGDKKELDYEPDFKVWEHVASESDMCLRSKCHYQDRCFFQKAREKMEDANLLIANHHMFFADLAIRKETGFNSSYSILPDYEVLVLDEAHNVENTARNYFSYEVSRYSFSKIMNNIYSYKGEKSKNAGILPTLIAYLRKEDVEKDIFYEVNRIINDELYLTHKDLYEKFIDFFTKTILFFAGDESRVYQNHRLVKDVLDDNNDWNEKIVKRVDEIKSVYKTYIKSIHKIQNLLEDKDYEDEDGVIFDFNKYIERLKDFFETLEFIMAMNDEAYVYWVDLNVKKSNIKMIATPLEIDEELQNNLFENIKTIIFTSATLAVDKSFSYLKKALGLQEEVIEKIIYSSFDYKTQMNLLIPKDVKMPNEREFNSSIADFIIEMIELTRGNTFLLFTSYSNLNQIFYMTREKLENDGYEILLQGSMPRHKLLEMYKISEKPVLFGTDSFWEGVDVKGEKLTSVFIVKLPFKVPTDPVIEAIIQKIKNEGGNPFYEYQIPEAVIKFKQGIGRLIRSKTDKGYITILDKRIITKSYGKKFIRSIPETNYHIEDKSKLMDIVKKM